MGGGGSKASGGGGKNVSRGDVCRVDKQHDSSRPCPSGGEGRYSAHDICFKGRVYSDKGRADGCYDRTDKFCTTGSSYPSAHSTSRGGEGSKSTGGKKEESKAGGLSYGGTIEYSGGYPSSWIGYRQKAIDLDQFLHTKYIPQDVIGTTGNSNKIYNGTHSEETMKVINFIQTQSYNKGWGSSALYHGPGGIEGSYRATVINLAYTDMYDLDLCNLGVLLRDL